ncbi:hypothetical protein COE56_01225 [Bacillus anthracis]|nr:hypothetical protein COE56_01225 [Bacillus anthracis]
MIRVKDIEIVEGLRKQDMLALHTAIDRYGDLIYKVVHSILDTAQSNEVDLKVCVWNEVVYMKTILDRKGGSEFLHIKYKNDKEYVLLGNADDYRELFQIVGGLKIANGIELRLQDKKLKRKLTLKRSVFNIIMYSLVIYIMYKAYINFMP